MSDKTMLENNIKLVKSRPNTLRLLDQAQQAQKWRLALENQIENVSSQRGGVRESEGARKIKQPNFSENNQYVSSAKLISPIKNDVVDNTPEKEKSEPFVTRSEHSAAHIRPYELKTLNNPRVYALDRPYSPVLSNEKISLKNVQKISSEIAQESRLEYKNAWSIREITNGLELVYRGPVLSESDFKSISSFYRLIHDHKEKPIVRVTNNGQVVFELKGRVNGTREGVVLFKYSSSNIVNRLY